MSETDGIRSIADWWWDLSEAERDESAGLSAAAARRSGYDAVAEFWRGQVRTDQEHRYVEDRLERVARHLRNGTGARQVERTA